MTSRCNHVWNLHCSLGLHIMKENNVNWIHCVQVNIWQKGDVGGWTDRGVDKQTYITRNYVTHFPRGVIRILKL
jgi:hypothetical protein